MSPGAHRKVSAHEAGHAVIGLCHVDGDLIGGATDSVMSSGPGVWVNHIAHELTAYDLAATQAVYTAGIRAGQARSALVGAGLVNP